jgi:hypothetical protein
MRDINSAPTLNPSKPGASSNSDDFKDPHGSCQGPSGNGSGRSDDGSFKSMPVGGKSPIGEEYVSKYRPRGSGGGGDTLETGSELNDDGTGWA